MAWQPYQQRSSEIQAAVQAKAKQADPEQTAQAFYDANELGLLDDPALLAWLGQAASVQAASVQEQPVEQVPASADQPVNAYLREEDLYSVKTLRWLVQNANTPADKLLARDRYRELLFDLWRKYLAVTGETWYPPLQNDLWDRYKSIASDPDNA